MSDDDGATWKGGLLLDERESSYPDDRRAEDVAKMHSLDCRVCHWLRQCFIQRYDVRMTETHRKRIRHPHGTDVTAPPVVLLRQCLLDEVQVTPPTLRAALRQMGRNGDEDRLEGSVIKLRRGRFGEVFQEVVEAAYLECAVGWEAYNTAMRDFVMEAVFFDQPQEFSSEVAATPGSWLRSADRLPQIRAALACMRLAYLNRKVADEDRAALDRQWQPLRDASATC
ncbi:MAG: hypothetical protein ABGZ23_09765 [Fuerstiella sp.]|nr:hypothetical protein [Fuerstiella sp.]